MEIDAGLVKLYAGLSFSYNSLSDIAKLTSVILQNLFTFGNRNTIMEIMRDRHHIVTVNAVLSMTQ